MDVGKTSARYGSGMWVSKTSSTLDSSDDIFSTSEIAIALHPFAFPLIQYWCLFWTVAHSLGAENEFTFTIYIKNSNIFHAG